MFSLFSSEKGCLPIGGQPFSVGKISNGLALSVKAYRLCQLPQSGSPWQSTQTSSFCQGLSLWERWICEAKTERARTLTGSAALSQKAALQMPFPSTTPPVKRQFWKIRVCVAMKAPVGLLSGRAVCVSRWRGFAPTSSADFPELRNYKYSFR